MIISSFRNRFQNLLNNIYYIYYSSIFLQGLKKFQSDSNHNHLYELKHFYEKILKFPYLFHNKEIPNNNFIDQFKILPESKVKEAYLANKDLLLKIEICLKEGSIEIYEVIFHQEIENFLNKLSELIGSNKMQISFKRIKYFFLIFSLIFLIYLSPSISSILKERYLKEKETYFLISTADYRYKKNVNDILLLKSALEKYFQDNQKYPISSVGWDGILSPFGESKKEWLEGLAPIYIPELPVDPRNSHDPRHQYLYQSNGVDYKLISHSPENMSFIINNYPELIDPVRPTWAFGVWSENAINW
jgi:hypothetical protein